MKKETRLDGETLKAPCFCLLGKEGMSTFVLTFSTGDDLPEQQ
jgi:hypothetical protein